MSTLSHVETKMNMPMMKRPLMPTEQHNASNQQEMEKQQLYSINIDKNKTTLKMNMITSKRNKKENRNLQHHDHRRRADSFWRARKKRLTILQPILENSTVEDQHHQCKKPNTHNSRTRKKLGQPKIRRPNFPNMTRVSAERQRKQAEERERKERKNKRKQDEQR